jgi:predicted RecA/RadA family phage recombinase
MKNQVLVGDAIDAYLTGTINAGQGVQVGVLFGIAATSLASSVSGPVSLWTKGAYQLTKNSAEAWVFGQPVYWDAVNTRATVSNGAVKGATSAGTATSSGVLTFTATPAGVQAGMVAYDETNGSVLGVVASTTATTAVLTNNVAQAVTSADVISFGLLPIGIAIGLATSAANPPAPGATVAANPSSTGYVKLSPWTYF